MSAFGTNASQGSRASRWFRSVPLLSLAIAGGCVVPQSRYDRLVTEYNAENQARRQLEDELQRRDSSMADLRGSIRERDEMVSGLQASNDASQERIAQLEAALEDARKDMAPMMEGVEISRTPDGLAYSIADSLLFDSGSTAIRDAGKRALVQISKQIQDKGYRAVRIDGHTDIDPVLKTKDKYPLGNYELALERALAVFAVMTRDGKVPENVFTIAGYGPSRPLVEGSSATAKSKNRRVEIHIAVPDQS